MKDIFSLKSVIHSFLVCTSISA